jgi:hypothetical protein
MGWKRVDGFGRRDALRTMVDFSSPAAFFRVEKEVPRHPLRFVLDSGNLAMTTEPPSPYTPPQAVETGPPGLPEQPPAVIKVFGIIHLAFAALGLIGAVMSVVGMLFLGKMGSLIEGQGGRDGTTAPFSALEGYMSEIAWFSVLSTGISVLLAILLIVAGIKLLRQRANAVAWSNGYAWTSIVTKVGSLVITLLFVLPAAARMNQAIGGDAQQAFTGITTVLGAVASFAYPVVVLVLLNRPAVKGFLASRGT